MTCNYSCVKNKVEMPKNNDDENSIPLKHYIILFLSKHVIIQSFMHRRR